MSFLAPLYLLGLAALSLPVVFHLIRRRPSNRAPFSSVMFLQPSPPRLTKRSRVEHWLLLALRAAALALLAFAFARPFLPEATELQLAGPPSRRVAILLDTSASMRRAGLWEQALAKARETLDEIGAEDDVALFTFDARVSAPLGWGGEERAGGRERATLARRRLADLAPTWNASDLGAALVQTADSLEATRQNDAEGDAAELELMLISDMQRGAKLGALQAYQWPEAVRLRVKPVEPTRTTNATARVLAQGVDGRRPAKVEAPRVRITNAADSTAGQFRIEWFGEAGADSARSALSHYVPPGESRVVRLPQPEGAPVKGVRLLGDDHAFDNSFYVAAPPAKQAQVVYIGDQTDETAPNELYFLERALPSTGRVEVSVERYDDRPEALDDERLALIVVAAPLDEATERTVLRRAAEGVNLLCVVTDADMQETLRTLSGDEDLTASEANVRDYALLSRVNFDDLLFAPFADPRYSDFTKVHFWRHRTVTVTPEDGWRTLAEFDSGDPAVLAKLLGDGALYVITSGWRPAESQLALSSKFVPMMWQLVRPSLGGKPASVSVGEPIPLADFSEPIREVRRADGEVRAAEAVGAAFAADAPGVYTFVGEQAEHPVAVNLAPSESDTDAITLAALAPYGVNLEDSARAAPSVDVLRRLKNTEIERRQSLWRWLLVAVVVLLLVETLAAGRRSHGSGHAAAPA